MHMSPWHSLSSSQRWQEKMCKLDPAFDTQLFMEAQLSFPLLRSCWPDWQKQKLHFAALVLETWQQKAQLCGVLFLICLHQGIIYTKNKGWKLEMWDYQVNHWYLAGCNLRYAAVQRHSRTGRSRHCSRVTQPTFRTTKLCHYWSVRPGKCLKLCLGCEAETKKNKS